MYAIASLDYIVPEQHIADVDSLADYLPRNTLRRMSHYERMGLLSAVRCLEKTSGHFKRLVCAPERMGVITATCYGPVDSTFSFLDSALEAGHGLTSPTAFSTSVYNILSTTITMHAAITGPALSISQGSTSLSAAILQAGLWLKSRRADYVLLGAVDQYSPYLNVLLGELADPAIMPSQDVALFMLLTNAANSAANHIICDAGYGLWSGDNFGETLDGKPLQAQVPAPCGPVHSLLQAVASNFLTRQRCCLTVPGYGFSYVDIKGNHASRNLQ